MKLPEPSERHILHIFPGKQSDRVARPNPNDFFPQTYTEITACFIHKARDGLYMTEERDFNA